MKLLPPFGIARWSIHDPIQAKSTLFYWGRYTVFKKRRYLNTVEYLLFDFLVLRIKK